MILLAIQIMNNWSKNMNIKNAILSTVAAIGMIGAAHAADLSNNNAYTDVQDGGLI